MIRKSFWVLLAAIPTVALAQTAPPAESPSTFTIVLTAQELGQIATLLREAPYKIAAPLITNIQRQAQAQIQAIPPQRFESPKESVKP